MVAIASVLAFLASSHTARAGGFGTHLRTYSLMGSGPKDSVEPDQKLALLRHQASEPAPILAGGFLGIRTSPVDLSVRFGGIADYLLSRYLTFMASAACHLGIVDIDTTDGNVRNQTNVQVLVGVRMPLR